MRVEEEAGQDRALISTTEMVVSGGAIWSSEEGVGM
jgi:hypothetical protein